MIAAYGLSGDKNEDFKIVQPFHLDNWFHIVGPIDFNKGVLYYCSHCIHAWPPGVVARR